MTKYKALAIVTSYWKPQEDFLSAIIKAIANRVENGDFVVVSEKALSTASGNIVDENGVQPSFNARFLAGWWMRVCWGHVFSALLAFGQRLTRNLREYPLDSGSRHKQVALERAGPLQALMFGSEGGIDGSNLPYAYVSLTLNKAQEIAEKIRRRNTRKTWQTRNDCHRGHRQNLYVPQFPLHSTSNTDSWHPWKRRSHCIRRRQIAEAQEKTHPTRSCGCRARHRGGAENRQHRRQGSRHGLRNHCMEYG